jgi:hypothetical protein
MTVTFCGPTSSIRPQIAELKTQLQLRDNTAAALQQDITAELPVDGVASLLSSAQTPQQARGFDSDEVEVQQRAEAERPTPGAQQQAVARPDAARQERKRGLLGWVLEQLPTPWRR